MYVIVRGIMIILKYASIIWEKLFITQRFKNNKTLWNSHSNTPILSTAWRGTFHGWGLAAAVAPASLCHVMLVKQVYGKLGLFV